MIYPDTEQKLCIECPVMGWQLIKECVDCGYSNQMFQRNNENYPCLYDESLENDIIKRVKSDYTLEQIDGLIEQLREIKDTRKNHEKYVIEDTVFYYDPRQIEIDDEILKYMREISGRSQTYLIYDEPEMGITFYEEEF